VGGGGECWRGRLFHSATIAKKNAAGEVVFKESSESYLIFKAWREPRGTLPNKQPQVQTEIGVSSVKYPSKR